MNKHPKSPPGLARFFAITFGISWGFWALAGVLPSSARVLLVAGTFGPAVAALVVTWPNPAARRALMRRLVRWRIPVWVYLYSIGLPIGGVLLALVVARGLTGAGPIWPQPMAPIVPVAVFAYVLVFSVAGEELGWRGYALPALLPRYGPVAASLGLGVVWAVWHAPLFLMPGNFHSAIPPMLFAAQIVASSLVYTHLHLAAGASLLPAHLFHTAFNTAVGLFPVLPQSRGGDITALTVAVALLCGVAAITALRIRTRVGLDPRADAGGYRDRHDG
ncbi:CPBP family intramembrane metalloprotease [Thalassococcus sp. CAU 1522]|uniref:CPBP family intramembrane metalloprotease n=1 Tax=Thalassococcus arenae TaxID=2851652 RepID=A0ABS6N541_9RHOB|nr:type II CAAX endopeptidase family protein [Thalassococcus arenae]MBV2359120.1 CPBP family intramembrane metalloprotease [Thalassococcus arenae]